MWGNPNPNPEYGKGVCGVRGVHRGTGVCSIMVCSAWAVSSRLAANSTRRSSARLVRGRVRVRVRVRDSLGSGSG